MYDKGRTYYWKHILSPVIRYLIGVGTAAKTSAVGYPGGFGDEEKTAGNLSTSLSKDANALGKLHQGIFQILLNQWSHPISIC